jgi:hypothetical protein
MKTHIERTRLPETMAAQESARRKPLYRTDPAGGAETQQRKRRSAQQPAVQQQIQAAARTMRTRSRNQI